MTIFERIHARSFPLIQAYQNDLLVHDKNALEINAGMPFIHATSANGTHLIFFPSPDDPCYPSKGEMVPYLFGRADREHILKGRQDTIEYLTEQGSVLLWLWYSGEYLIRVTGDQAKEIVVLYRAKTLDAWKL